MGVSLLVEPLDVPEEAGYGKEDDGVGCHHDVSKDKYDLHEVNKTLSGLILLAIIFLRIVEGVAVDEPSNNGAVYDY